MLGQATDLASVVCILWLKAVVCRFSRGMVLQRQEWRRLVNIQTLPSKMLVLIFAPKGNDQPWFESGESLLLSKLI